MELTLIKERLNDDCISVILSFIDISPETVIKEAKERTVKLYKTILEKVPFGKNEFKVCKTYIHIMRKTYKFYVYYDVFIFKVVKKTKCFLFIKCSKNDNGTDIENNDIKQIKCMDDEFSIKRCCNPRSIKPCECLEFDKSTHFNWYMLEAPRDLYFEPTLPVHILEKT